MTETELAEWLQHCPTLYHMAEAGSWPSIQRHGLLSTAALLELFGVPEPRQSAILRAHRPGGVKLHHPRHGIAHIRDQKPMSDAALRRCLQDGLAPADWYALLNARVFFWPTRKRLLGLLCARPYRALDHDVLELDTGRLLQTHRAAVALSPINSGSTFNLGPAPRGLATFQPVAAFDYAARRRTHPPPGCIAELTVAHAVPTIAPFVRRAVRMRQAAELAVLWQGPSTAR